MKHTLTMILSVMLCIVLVTGAVCLGAVRGWRAEREEASTFLSGTESLAERAMDTANLLVVASRHLPTEDPSLTALRNARQILTGGSATVEEIIAADNAITAAAQELAGRLPALASVKASARDQAYIDSLTRILGVETGAAAMYREEITAFNERMSRSLTGKLAMFCGVEPLPQ